MNKKILLIILLLINCKVYAQNDSINTLWNEVISLKATNLQLKQNEKLLQQKIDNQQVIIDSICAELGLSTISFHNAADSLNNKISNAEVNSKEKYQALDDSIGKNIILVIVTFLFSIGLLFGIALIIRRKQRKDKVEVFEKISSTKKVLEDEAIKMDTKLLELLESQLKIQSEEKSLKTMTDSSIEPDHSLALKVADNIARIQMNLANMDQSTKGLKQLSQAVNSVIDNFKANGYEIIDLLNQPYNEGMKVIANMEPDEKLKTGEQIIKRVIKPQVNFKGKMIQSAQVVVAYGE